MMLVIYLNHDATLVSDYIKLLQEQPLIILIFFFFIIILSINYILKILAQLFFDNFIKVNYESNFPLLKIIYKKENDSFVRFREKVLTKLRKDSEITFTTKDISDFELYQLLGRVLDYYEKETNVRRYATDAKEAGVTIVSILISLLWYIFLESDGVFLFAILIIYPIAIEYIKSKYRSRAYRMYANYLIGDKPIKEIPEV